MSSIYDPCPCNSGKKYKFCCNNCFKRLSPIASAQKAVDYPLHDCVATSDWRGASQGLATVVLSRKMPNGNYILGSYLVDTWCLGVKNTFLHWDVKHSEIGFYKQFDNNPISYEDARSLILGALDYAKNIKIEPTEEDWDFTQYFIESKLPYIDKFTFGKNGKPHYYPGPRDENLEEVIAKVYSAGGTFQIPFELDGFIGRLESID